jgi:hypothetical protein
VETQKIKPLSSVKQIGPQYVRQKMWRLMRRDIAVKWARWGLISEFIAHSLPTKKPAILIISLPRSGSSWVGDILGASPSAMYLREPINLTFSKSAPNRSFFEITTDRIREGYLRISDIAFKGLPSFPKTIVINPHQWALTHRRKKRVIIKEINPLALSSWIPRYHLRIVYLIRHPAAVANSFYQQHWTGEQFTSRFTPSTLKQIDYQQYQTSFWNEHGAMQAFVQKLSLDTLRNYADYLIVKYEDLCLNPSETFRRVYDFCDIQWDADIDEKIHQMSNQPVSVSLNRQSSFRNSFSMINKWKSEMDEFDINQVKASYLELEPAYYIGEQDWLLSKMDR